MPPYFYVSPSPHIAVVIVIIAVVLFVSIYISIVRPSPQGFGTLTLHTSPGAVPSPDVNLMADASAADLEAE